MAQDHSHALANLATATQSDCTTVANMSKTITDLTLQLGQANAKLVEAQSSIATLTSKLAQTGTRHNPPHHNSHWTHRHDTHGKIWLLPEPWFQDEKM